MKYLLIIALLIISTISIAQNTLTLENHKYESTRVSVFVLEYNSWIYIDNYYIGPNQLVTINIGNDDYRFYGFKESGTNYITNFYSNWIIFY